MPEHAPGQPGALPPAPAPPDPRYQRRHGTVEDRRTASQRDRDRILYTSALRRLAGVTQVVSPGEGHIFHNRLTHTLEVAQIARRLAEYFLQDNNAFVAAHGGIDPDVVESAALAHDLGHPPFGHVAEEELNRLVCAAGLHEGYEGNAQSFRIITKLAIHGEGDSPGLDLTRATLNATLKYPWPQNPEGPKRRKWGFYSSEGEDFAFARQGFAGAAEQPCLEAQLMTWADDIAYAVHDTEDFYRAGLIPLDRLATNPDERTRFLDAACRALRADEPGSPFTRQQYREAFQEFCDLLPIDQPYDGTLTSRTRLRTYTSTQIGRYLNSITPRQPTGPRGELLQMPAPIQMQINLVKQLTWTYVIDSAALAAQQLGQRKVIKVLFRTYLRGALAREWRMLPASYREQMRSAGSVDATVRLVADMVAGMTDEQALRMHRRITGQLPGSVLDQIWIR